MITLVFTLLTKISGLGKQMGRDAALLPTLQADLSSCLQWGTEPQHSRIPSSLLPGAVPVPDVSFGCSSPAGTEPAGGNREQGVGGIQAC